MYVCVHFIHCTPFWFECLNCEGNYCTNSHSRTKQVVSVAHTLLYANNHTMKYMTLYRFQSNGSAALHHSSDEHPLQVFLIITYVACILSLLNFDVKRGSVCIVRLCSVYIWDCFWFQVRKKECQSPTSTFVMPYFVYVTAFLSHSTWLKGRCII